MRSTAAGEEIGGAKTHCVERKVPVCECECVYCLLHTLKRLILLSPLQYSIMTNMNICLKGITPLPPLFSPILQIHPTCLYPSTYGESRRFVSLYIYPLCNALLRCIYLYSAFPTAIIQFLRIDIFKNGYFNKFLTNF